MQFELHSNDHSGAVVLWCCGAVVVVPTGSAKEGEGRAQKSARRRDVRNVAGPTHVHTFVPEGDKREQTDGVVAMAHDADDDPDDMDIDGDDAVSMDWDE